MSSENFFPTESGCYYGSKPRIHGATDASAQH